MKRTILQRMLNKLDGTNERTASAIRDFEGGVKTLREKLQQEISASTLEEVNLKINKLRKSIDLEPLQTSLQNLSSSFEESVLSILKDIETKSAEQKNLTLSGDKNLASQAESLGKEIDVLRETLDGLVSSNKTELNLINNELGRLLASSQAFATKEELSSAISKNQGVVTLVETKSKENVEGVKKEFKEFRQEFLERLSHKGGGNMNRNILINNNPSTLAKYTDLNIKAGSNVTITYTTNNNLKTTDVTIASSGGGGSVGGTVRQIQTISVSSTIGTLSGTDQVYLCDQGVKLTLPTAVGDTNLYTIKNISNSSVMVVGDGVETIDDQANIIMPIKYTSVDLVSDGSNFKIT